MSDFLFLSPQCYLHMPRRSAPEQNRNDFVLHKLSKLSISIYICTYVCIYQSHGGCYIRVVFLPIARKTGHYIEQIFNPPVSFRSWRYFCDYRLCATQISNATAKLIMFNANVDRLN